MSGRYLVFGCLGPSGIVRASTITKVFLLPIQLKYHKAQINVNKQLVAYNVYIYRERDKWYTYIHIHTNIYAYIHTYIHTYMQIYIHVRVYVCKYVGMCVFM